MANAVLKDVMPGILGRMGMVPNRMAIMTFLEKEIENLSRGRTTIRIVGYKNETIYVEVESSVELQEWSFRKRELTKKIEAAFPERTAPKILFFVGGSAKPSRKAMLSTKF